MPHSGFKPRTVFLWGNSVNHHNTVLPRDPVRRDSLHSSFSTILWELLSFSHLCGHFLDTTLLYFVTDHILSHFARWQQPLPVGQCCKNCRWFDALQQTWSKRGLHLKTSRIQHPEVLCEPFWQDGRGCGCFLFRFRYSCSSWSHPLKTMLASLPDVLQFISEADLCAALLEITPNVFFFNRSPVKLDRAGKENKSNQKTLCRLNTLLLEHPWYHLRLCKGNKRQAV